jgi:hypothetical protein
MKPSPLSPLALPLVLTPELWDCLQQLEPEPPRPILLSERARLLMALVPLCFPDDPTTDVIALAWRLRRAIAHAPVVETAEETEVLCDTRHLFAEGELPLSQLLKGFQ